MATAGKPLTVECPHCRRPAVYAPGNPWRPFCSERCRSLDLGAWSNEEFRVPASNTDRDDDAEPTAPPSLSSTSKQQD